MRRLVASTTSAAVVRFLSTVEPDRVVDLAQELGPLCHLPGRTVAVPVAFLDLTAWISVPASEWKRGIR